ncbi:hypothetical protein BDV19DRAFT_368229 [Aspergillus venezuelensis]
MDSKLLLARKNRRKKLAKIYRSLDQFNPVLTSRDLHSLGIQQQPMTLEGGNHPLFFARYDDPVQKPKNKSYANYIEFDQNPFYDAQMLAGFLDTHFNYSKLPEEKSHPAGAYYRDWGDFNFGELSDLTWGSQWQVETVWHMEPNLAPHMVVLMFSDMPDVPGLYHGEVKTAIRVMHGRLREPAFRDNVTAPVLIFSAIGGHHLRVIEAYHDGEKLIMRTTKPYDMSKRDDNLINELTRWRLGGPTDKTTKLV